jgi:hypothetical protein
MRDDERERAFLEPIERELSRKVDNSDAALIRRALDIRMKSMQMIGGPFDNTDCVSAQHRRDAMRPRRWL